MPVTTTPSFKSKVSALAPALFIWAILAVVSILKDLPKLRMGILPGNDDYMRLVQVRDWLDGQGWTNLTQSRLYPPDPLQFQWARFSDILIGGMIKLFTPFFGTQGAELAALIIVPVLLSLLMIILVAKIATRLSDNPWMPLTSCLMAVLCAPIFMQFAIGRIDHHGLQLVLALSVVLALLKSEERAIWAAAAGIACGLSLWVGIESAPYVAAACIVTGLFWVLAESRGAIRMRFFALALFGSTALLHITSRPAAQWLTPACDALSSVYVVLCALIAVAMLCASALKFKSPAARLFTLGAFGAAALAVTLLLYPQCLKGPYAELDPRLAQVWLANVAEALSIKTFIVTRPVDALSILIIPILAFIAIGLWLKREGFKAVLIDNRPARMLTIFITLTFLAALIQIRVLTFAGAFAAPMAALLMARGLVWSECISNDVKRAFTRAGILIALSPIMVPLVVKALFDLTGTPSGIEAKPTAQALAQMEIGCIDPRALRALGALEPGFAITPIDLGAPILAVTDNLSVSSAPYHRNEGGNSLSLDVFMGTADTAKAAVSAAGADYVIACKDYVEMDLILRYAPTGLLSQLQSGDEPSWLARVQTSEKSPLLIYRVKL